MEELISVIIPVYNVENTLKKCVMSVINQTYKNLQIILVDDGSTDLSPVICDDLAELDSRVVVIHRENGGLCAARNTGLSVAEGEYIGFVDSDDWVTNDMYEYLINGLKSYDADICACRYFRVIEGEETNSRCNGEDIVFSRDEAIVEIIEKFNLRSVFWNKLFKRSIFDDITFPEGHTFEGTYMMHEVFDKADKIVMLGQPKYYYVKNPKSIIYNKNIKTDIQYAHSNVKRFNDLIERFPKNITKLTKDCAENISKVSLKCKNVTQKQIDESKEQLEYIADFIKANIDTLCMYYGNSSLKRKEYLAFAKLSVSGLKRAYKYSSKFAKKKKLEKAVHEFFRVFLGVNLKYKDKNLLPKPKKALSGSYISGVVVEEGSEVKANLDKLHECEMKIVMEIDRICKKCGITYYLYGGTLLGAVRHKGFIPWDDDVDLVMPREDFDKFAKACETELGSEYFYQTCFTDPAYPLLLAKVRMNRTRVTENKWSDSEMHSGCFVDILPLDYFPADPIRSKLFLQIARILHHTCRFDKTDSSHLIAHIAFKLIKRKGTMYAYTLRDKFLRYVNKHGSMKYYCSFGSHYKPMIRRRLEVDWFGTPSTMIFEGQELPVPEQWEKYLLHLFGDSYMELPPIEDRVCHTDFERIIIDPERYDKWVEYKEKAIKSREK